MSTKLRREKDIIGRSVEKFVKATTEDYSKWLEGSPTYLTYYQLASEATKQDSSLENVHSLIGTNTPNKYKRIYDVVAYGASNMDPNTMIAEQGLTSELVGELVFIPDSIRPYPGDFFVFDTPGFESHLFRVTDVQFDKATLSRFYKIQFSIFPDSPDLIFDNVIDDLTLIYDNIGGQNTTIVKQADAITKENVSKITDELITDYISDYYDEDMDTFVYKNSNTDKNYWMPYVQQFISETGIFSKYKQEIYSDIYIPKLSERDLGKEIFNERLYRDSIFYKIQRKNPSFTIEDNFMLLTTASLKHSRNMPFFNSPDDYEHVGLFNKSESEISWMFSFPFLFKEPSRLSTVDPKFKIASFEELDPDVTFEFNDILYLMDGLRVKGFSKRMLLPSSGSHFNIDAKALSTLEERLPAPTNEHYDIDEALKTILDFFFEGESYKTPSGEIKQLPEFEVDEDRLLALNDLYLENSFRNYILVPLLIYVLKKY